MSDRILLYLYRTYKRDPFQWVTYRKLEQQMQSRHTKSGTGDNFQGALVFLKGKGWIFEEVARYRITAQGTEQVERILNPPPNYDKQARDAQTFNNVLALITIIFTILFSIGVCKSCENGRIVSPAHQGPVSAGPTISLQDLQTVQSHPISVGDMVVAINNCTLRRTPGYVDKPADDRLGWLVRDDVAEVIGGPRQVDGLIWWEVEVKSGTSRDKQGWIAERNRDGLLLLRCQE